MIARESEPLVRLVLVAPRPTQKAGTMSERSLSRPSSSIRFPDDELALAQAHAERLALVSKETTFDRYGVARVW